MQAFGLIGLLVTVTLAVWWLTNTGSISTTTVDDGGESYKSAVDSAQGAVDLMEKQ